MEDNQPNTEGNQTAETQENMIPHSRFNEVNTELKAAREQLAAFEKAKAAAAQEAEAAQQKQLAEQNRWKELYETETAKIAEFTPYKERWESHVTATAERNTKRLADIPEAMKSLVPEYDDPLKVSKWLDSNWQTLTAKASSPNLDGGAGGGGRGANRQSTMTWQEVQRQASAFGISPVLLAQQNGVAIPTA